MKLVGHPFFAGIFPAALFLLLTEGSGAGMAAFPRAEIQATQTGASLLGEEGEETQVRANRDLATALNRAAEDGWQDLRLECECQTDSGWTSVEVFGNGVGIWNNMTQFQLERPLIQSMLKDFRQLGFASLRKSYGKDTESDGELALRVNCRLSLSIDGAGKQVVQFDKGEQSKEVREIARRVFETCRKPSRSGISALSLEDGLKKIVEGELAIETLTLTLNRKPDSKALEEGVEGWLLSITRGEAAVQAYTSAGLGNQWALRLDSREIIDLASALSAEEAGSLPINLYSEHYTDLALSVLKWKITVQARQFAKMTPDTHGEKQLKFDAIFERLSQLAGTVRLRGKQIAE